MDCLWLWLVIAEQGITLVLGFDLCHVHLVINFAAKAISRAETLLVHDALLDGVFRVDCAFRIDVVTCSPQVKLFVIKPLVEVSLAGTNGLNSIHRVYAGVKAHLHLLELALNEPTSTHFNSLRIQTHQTRVREKVDFGLFFVCVEEV